MSSITRKRRRSHQLFRRGCWALAVAVVGAIVAPTVRASAATAGVATTAPTGHVTAHPTAPPAPVDVVGPAAQSALGRLSAAAAAQQAAVDAAAQSIGAPSITSPVAAPRLAVFTPPAPSPTPAPAVKPKILSGISGTTASSLAAALAPGGGTNFADYAYRTIYTPTTGTPVTRYTEAVLGTATPINVTGSGGTQFTGTISPASAISPTGVSLKIQRAASMPATDKVSIEAVLLDPASASTYFGFGEDGSAAGTAATWRASVSLLSLSSSSIDFGLSPVKATTPPASLAVLAELFAGTNPDSPTAASRGNVAFAPVPSTAGVTVTLAAGSVEAKLTNGSSTPSVVTADVTSFDAVSSQHFRSTINALASSVDLKYTTSSGVQTVTYTAAAGAKQLKVSYQRQVGGVLTTAAAVVANNVPTGLTFTAQHTAPEFAVTTTGGAIGSMQARFGAGTNLPASPSGSGAYLAFTKTATTATVGARLSNLTALTLDADQPFSVNLHMTTALASLALSSSDTTTGLAWNGTVTSLPAHSSVVADLTTSSSVAVVTLNGYGTGFGKLQVDATKTAPFFGRVTRVDTTATGIPPKVTFGFSKSAASLTASSSAPLGNLSLLLSDGSAAPTVSGPMLDYVNTTGRFVAYANLNAFDDVVYGSSAATPLSASVNTNTIQTLALSADTTNGVFTGSVNQLPQTAAFALTLDSAGDQVLTVNDSAPVLSITLAGNTVPLPVPATNLAFTLSRVPTKLTLALPGPGQGLTFTASAAIGEIKGQAWQTGTLMNTKPDALSYDDRVDEYRAALDIDGLQKLTFDPPTTTKPMNASATTHTTTPMNLTTTVLLDGQNNQYAAIDCPSTTQCTASTGSGRIVTFDPATPTAPVVTNKISNGASINAITCASATQCTAIVPALETSSVPAIGTDTGVVTEGGEVTFDPTTAATLTPTVIDPNEPLTALSCPTANLCVSADSNEDLFTFDPTSPGSTTHSSNSHTPQSGAIVGLACPNATQCTAITNGTWPSYLTPGTQEFSFDPANFAFIGPGAATFVGPYQMREVACPSTGECTIVDNTGKNYVFPPLSVPLDINGGVPLVDIPSVLSNSSALACVSNNQCTVLAGDTEETFDPVSGAVMSDYPIDIGNTMLSLSCPSSTQCTTIDNTGQQITFNPLFKIHLVGNGGSDVITQSLIGSQWSITSTIAQLPATMSLKVTPGSGGALNAVYKASAPIPTMTLDAAGLPISQDSSRVHVRIAGIPSGFVLQIPADGGTISFSPCASAGNCTTKVSSLVAQVYGATPIGVPNILNQAVVYDAVTSEATVGLGKIGGFSVSESAAPITLDYDISSTPLNIAVTTGQVLNADMNGKSGPAAQPVYLDALISNPAPFTKITLSEKSSGAEGVYLNYSAGASINEITVITNAGNNYFEGTLQSLPQNLTVCADTQPNGTPCNLWCPTSDLIGTYDSACLNEPVPDGWIAPRTGAGWTCYGFGTESAPCPGPADGYEVFKSDSAWIQILPTDSSGLPPSTPMNVNIYACPAATAYECVTDTPVGLGPGAYPALLYVKNLKFSTLELGLGTGSISGENYGMIAANTDPKFGLHVDEVGIWAPGDQVITHDPVLAIDNTSGGKGGIIANRFTAFGEQDGTEIKVFTTDVGPPGSPGSWKCINPLNLEVVGFDVAPLFGC